MEDAQSWTALFRAFSSHQQPSAYLTKGIPQLDKTLGHTGQTLRARSLLRGRGFLANKQFFTCGTLQNK